MAYSNRNSNNTNNINNILETHFSNINILANAIRSSQYLIQDMQSENRLHNTRTRTSSSLFDSIFNNGDSNTRRPLYRNNHNTDNYYNTGNTPTRNRDSVRNNSNNVNYQQDNENNVYYFTFDALNTPLNNQTNVYAQDISFRTLLIREENKDIINNSDISLNSSTNEEDYQLYEITQFDFIEGPLNDVCPITRERFDSTTEHILMIKKCKHIFNKSALNIWLENNSTCPCCRGQI